MGVGRPFIGLHPVPNDTVLLICAAIKYGFDGHVEEPCNAERQRKRWIVLASLDCIYGLTRHPEMLSQRCLAPFSLSPQDAETVFHRLSFQRMN